jgi:phenylacetyl-CoA:acceptor oxidoreductase subunit 1
MSRRWGIVIDLKKCSGCMTCVASCKLNNGLPPHIYFTKIFDYEVGKYPNVMRKFLPVMCMHCEEPPCVDACPTKASQRREDGIVYVDIKKCMGCRYCMIVCPYGMRSYLDGTTNYYTDNSQLDKYIKHKQDSGIVVKCDLCRERIDKGLKNGLKPGIDEEATPMCVISCLSNARYFGDLNDPNSTVSKLIRERKHFRLHEELGTNPSIYYID